MESAEPIPEADEPGRDLAELVGEPGEFLSVLLTTDPAVENAAQRSELRWKTLRSDLEHRGIGEEVLAAVDPFIPEAHLHGPRLEVVVSETGARHVEHGGDPNDATEHEDGRWGRAPWLFPILSWRQATVPHLVVLIDRSGADLFVVRREGPAVHAEVDPPGEPLTRSKPGGWSQRRYQQRAENSWEKGAGDVAKGLVRLVERFEPRIVVVAGDVRAVQFLREALPKEMDEIVRVTSGERPNPDGSGGIPQDEVDELVAELVQRDTDEVLAKFEEELGQGDLAAEGPGAVVEALQKAQVEVLLIRDDTEDERTVWIGSEPVHIGMTRDRLEAMGVDDSHEARFRDATVRAAIGTAARIRLLPEGRGPREGIGAILRWK
jgi:Bacterial archaeo-eukaryotic release factor family 2